ncbi:hypothetical protein NPIL_399851 [Nephila pilipes]|uniref:Uncharacterized protein n=1 Tax=Nephila pilipes TaxID=299642 RepID=A0A8X6TQZ5_NEPPI|nr:hypothetical protein NPIL_399851 [Nephila pilipes]
MLAYLWLERVKTKCPRGRDLFVAFSREKNDCAEFEDFLFGFHYEDFPGCGSARAPGQRMLTFPWRGLHLLQRKEKMSYAPGLQGPGANERLRGFRE